MTDQQKFDWNEDRSINKMESQEEDSEAFALLLKEKEKQEKKITSMTPDQILTGKILEVTKEFAVTDVGLKSEALIPVSEFLDPEELKVGTEVEVYLMQKEGEEGQIVLSREKAYRYRQWEQIVENYQEGSLIRGKIVQKVKGGLIVDIGIEAFLPGSQIDNKRTKNLTDYLGESHEFKILKIDVERKNIVLSRRQLLEEERISKKTELLETIQSGQICKGVVKNITEFGAFLDLNGIDGLLHLKDMAWKRVRHPTEMVEVGQELEVMILEVDKEKGRIALGIKQKEQNPWQHIEEKYTIGQKIQGKVVNLVPYGAFIEIQPGIEGLVHISEMSWTKNISDPSEVVQKGELIEAVILSIQKEEERISLGIKQTQSNPWEELVANHAVGDKISVEICDLRHYGAIARLDNGIEGLLHISDFNWTRKVSHPSEVVQKGQRVDVAILSIDEESRKIALGLKQLSDNPWKIMEKSTPVGTLITGTVSQITPFGAFVELQNGLEGLVHITELSEQPFGKVEEIVQIGEQVTAKVLKVDVENKKIALSIKACDSKENQPEQREDGEESLEAQQRKDGELEEGVEAQQREDGEPEDGAEPQQREDGEPEDGAEPQQQEES